MTGLRAMGWLLLAAAAFGQEPVIERATLQVDVVKRGDLIESVRGKGNLVSRKKAEITVPEFLRKYVKPGQTVFLEIPPRIFSGKVESVGEKITVLGVGSFAETTPPGAPVDALIETGKATDAVYLMRPVTCKPESEGTLFRMEPNGEFATRVKVRYGKYGHLPASVVEIEEGLRPGDRVILSDMSRFEGQDRVRLQ